MDHFKIGEKVLLAREYWVNVQGDCRNDSAAKNVPVGSKGRVTETRNGGGVISVVWDAVGYEMRVNAGACALADEVSDDELNEVLKSISATFQERKKH